MKRPSKTDAYGHIHSREFIGEDELDDHKELAEAIRVISESAAKTTGKQRLIVDAEMNGKSVQISILTVIKEI